MQKLLLFISFSLVAQLIFAQCQSIEAIITNSTPTIMPADTGWIDLCVGETLSLEGAGIYNENGQNYQQADSMSIFKWNFGDGNEAFGNLATHIYDTPGAYFVNLTITDSMGCQNQNLLNQRVRVHGFHPMLSASISENPICAGNAVTLVVEPDSSTTYDFTQPFLFINPDTLPIPDGDGSSVFTTISINEFPQGATFNNINQLNDICINIEHSWMRDLEIKLTAPNGTTIVLHDHPGQTGGQVFLGEPIDNDGGFPELGVGYDYCWAADAPNSTWIEYSNTNFPGTLPADTYSSADPITNLLGTSLNGEWTLTITDSWASDNGALFYWSLLFNEDEFIATEQESFDVNFISGEWLPDNSIVSNNQNTIVATPTETTTYTYQATDDFGCIQPFNYEITVFPADSIICQPCDSIIVTLPETQMFTCTNNTNGANILTPSIEPGNLDLDFQWSAITGTFLNNTLDEASVSILGPGTYILTTSFPPAGCVQMDTIVITPTMIPNLDAGEDTTLFCSIPQYFSLMGTTDGTDISFPLWTTPNGEITFGANTFQPTVSEPGTYFLTVLDNISNCLMRDTVEVFLHPQLIDSITVVDTDCNQTNGSATVHSAANPANLSIEWSNGETTSTITNLASGNYTVTLTDGNCTQEAIIFVDESDFCEVIIRGNVYQGDCNLGDVTLDWFNDFMSIELLPLGLEIHEPMPDGSYEFIVPPGEYTVKMANGPYIPNNTFAVSCPEDNQYTINLPLEGSISEGNDFFWQLTVGTEDLNKNITPLQISPNPTNGHFQINYTLPTSTITTLEVFSLSGKLAMPIFENKNQSIGEHFENINIENLPNGVYLVRLETEDSVYFERVIKH